MKIFVISMPESKERRKSIKSQLEKLQLDFEIIAAVNGKNLSEVDLNRFCDPVALKENSRWLNHSAIGCALSHKRAYERLIEQDLKGALILEDDIVIPDELPLLLKGVSEKVFENEISLFYYRGFKEVLLTRRDSRKITEKYQLMYPVSVENFLTTAAGYYITNEVCRKLLEVVTPIKVTAYSWRYFYNKNVFEKMSLLYPRALKDANFKSEIDYVGSYENKFKPFVLNKINQYKIPILYHVLKFRRSRIEKRMSQFKIAEGNPFFK